MPGERVKGVYPGAVYYFAVCADKGTASLPGDDEVRTNLHAVFDSASGAYQGPLKFQTDEMGVRWFGDIVQDAEHPIGQHPEDYSFCRVGQWDDNKGQLLAEPVEVLATGIEMVARARNVKRDDLEKILPQGNSDATISDGA